MGASRCVTTCDNLVQREDQKMNQIMPQKVKTERSAFSKKQALPVQREVFVTSREMDFFSEKELIHQTGHAVEEWPLVIVKELIDNALDACEDQDIPAEVVVSADETGIRISDNGPGLPEPTLMRTLDFSVRVSSREAYVSPDRGAQGNALKTLAAMPSVVDPEGGRFTVTTSGTRHEVSVFADPISQRPKVRHKTSPSDNLGSTIGVEWSPHEDEDGDVVWPFAGLLPLHDHRFARRFRRLVEGFAVFNPHVTITLDWFGHSQTWKATDPKWSKWKPSKPTNPHWYGGEHLERLIAAYVTHDRDTGNESRTVGEFLKIFEGLTGSANRRKVLADCDMHRLRLEELAGEDGLHHEAIQKLLAAMHAHTKPVKPNRLGLIGEGHFRARLMELGIVKESFEYRKKLNTDEDGLPYVLETAFGWRGEGSEDNRLIHAGANWSAAIHNPFRNFGSSGEGLEGYLRTLMAGQSEPIIYCVHLAHPRIHYTDRGKTALPIS